MKSYLMLFGKLSRDFRSEHGLKQYEVAQKLGLYSSNYSSYEAGERRIPEPQQFIDRFIEAFPDIDQQELRRVVWAQRRSMAISLKQVPEFSRWKAAKEIQLAAEAVIIKWR